MLDLSSRPLASVATLAPDFLAGGGDMGERMRVHDWPRSALGPAREWPQGLKVAARVLLCARQPMCILWGPTGTLLYNDACRAVLGDRHTAMFAQPAAAVWTDFWEAACHRVELALERGEGSSMEALRLVVDRGGSREEAHYNVTFNPLPGDSAAAGGVLCTFADVTSSVAGERGLALLAALCDDVSRATSAHGACAMAIESLARNVPDLGFGAIYFVDPVRELASIAASTGGPALASIVPSEFSIGPSSWPIARAALEGRGLQIVAIPEAVRGALPAFAGVLPREAAVVTLGAVEGGRVAVLVLPLHPLRALDDERRRFIGLVAAQVSAGLTRALARSEEGLRVEAEKLHEAAADFTGDLDLQSLVQKVTDIGTQFTGAQFGAFFYNMTDEAGESYQLYTLSGAPREAFAKFKMPRATPVFKPTFDGGAPIRSDDITKDPRYGQWGPHRGMPKGHLPVRSYLAVPVIARGGEVLGGLFFGHGEPGMFDERAERAAVGVATQAAVALDNARLYGRARAEIGRRSRVEGELRDSERRYRDLVETLPAAVYTTDAEGRIELYNDAAVRLWGRCPRAGEDKWCGSHRIFSAEGQPMSLEASPMARAVRHGEEIEKAELLIERPDGRRAHVIAHPRPIVDAAGKVTGAINMLVDITERIADEAELAVTKDKLADQVESLTSLHNLALRLGGMTQLEPALRAVLDTAVEAQRAHFGIVWVHEAEHGHLVPRASRGFDGEGLAHFGNVAPGPSGGSAGNAYARRCRWAVEDTESDESFRVFREGARKVGFRSVHSTPIVTRSGELLGVLSVHFRQPRLPTQRDMQVADVCARHAADAIEAHRSHAAVERSERIYRAIGESLDYGVWTANREGRVTYVSDSFLKLLGCTEAEWTGHTWDRFVHPDDVQGLLPAWRECVRAGRQWDRELRVRGVDRKWHSILQRAVPMHDANGEVCGWAGIHLDIQRLKQVENELRELDQRKNEFLATLAHELRNPLAPLRNGLEVLRIAHDNRTMAEKARAMMERQLHQMVRLVDDLLDVSRVSRGKIELRRDNVELAAVLRNAIETSQPLMTERGHELVARIPRERIVVYADMTRLSQVFWNLLNNAAKYTEAGGRIELDIAMRQGEVAVTVRDNGIGIPPEMHARVFDIFTQVDRSLEKSQGGLGIGLSIARRLVEMHGGRIQVESDGHGRGSAFTVTLPAAVVPDSAEIPSGAAAQAGVRPMACKRILIADDNTDSATTLSIMLEMLGNQVRVAHDGEAAVQAAREFGPDAILLDIGMPKLNGYDACARLRAIPETADAYMVALTGWGQEEDRNRAHAAGFDHHMVKPVEPALLEKLISELPARH